MKREERREIKDMVINTDPNKFDLMCNEAHGIFYDNQEDPDLPFHHDRSALYNESESLCDFN